MLPQVPPARAAAPAGDVPGVTDPDATWPGDEPAFAAEGGGVDDRPLSEVEADGGEPAAEDEGAVAGDDPPAAAGRGG